MFGLHQCLGDVPHIFVRLLTKAVDGTCNVRNKPWRSSCLLLRIIPRGATRSAAIMWTGLRVQRVSL
jgi:hypothetical protein